MKKIKEALVAAGKWVRKHWMWFLLIPPLLWAICKLLELLSRLFDPFPQKVYTGEREKELQKDVKAIDQAAEKKKEEIRKESEELKTGISKGNPSPAEIFRREIDGK